MAKALDTKAGQEFGKAMCDRFGLPHGMVLKDWDAISTDGRTVMVTLKVFKVMTASDYDDLWGIALRRSAGVTD